MNISVSGANLIRRTASLAVHPTLTLHSLEGEYDGPPLRLLVADDGSTLSYIQNLAFPEGKASVSRQGTISAFKAPCLIESEADVVVVGANCLLFRRYKDRGFYLVPKWVRLFLPVQEEPYARLYAHGRQTRKYFKWMLKKVNDAGFQCEITNDVSWFDRFYFDMYLPYAFNRYGELAIVHSYQKVRKAFLKGSGVVAMKDGKPVAGSIIFREGNTMRIPHAGVVEGGLESVKEGAAFALDYYVAQMAHSSGCKAIDFGHSRPFLSDGALRYKLNWRMDVVDDADAVSFLAIAAPRRTEQAAKFLSANMFYHLNKSGVDLCDEW
ncbi:MAG: hypothetical protein Q7N50_11230 [Armatimonadota bacterium]|nr:hypothetical protein [Armatimonadota bacterium]